MVGISELVASLPEVYQPIFGHAEIAAVRGAHESRISALLHVCEALVAHLGRPLRILDLGSAQGFISLTLAERGHRVVGIEHHQGNQAIAVALAAEHPKLDVTFLVGEVGQAPDLVDLSEFDLVVAFSILHHLIDRDGPASVDLLVEQLVATIPHAVFEMAVADEPLYWAASLPRDPRITLRRYPFIRQLCWSDTHLSDVRRPVFVCSSETAYVGGVMTPIVATTSMPHAQADAHVDGFRRYVWTREAIVKIVADYGSKDQLDGPTLTLLRGELRRERAALSRLPAGLVAGMDLLDFSDPTGETLLARRTAPGSILADVAAFLTDDELDAITGQLFVQLAQLEEAGFFHGDLRTWNVLWDGDARTARLIDFGAMGALATDVVRPHDGAWSLLLLLLALWSRTADQTGLEHVRAPRADLESIPRRGRRALAILLRSAAGPDLHRRVLAAWERPDAPGDGDIPISARWLQSLTVEVDRAEQDATRLTRELAAREDEIRRANARAASSATHDDER